MFKNIIAPIQAWLLSSGKCVGCGMPLKKGKWEKGKDKDIQKVLCKCDRVFIYNKKSQKYRRALFEEV